MPRGTLFTLEKRAKIDALSAEGLTPANIARRLNRTVNVVKRYPSNPREYAKRLFTTGNTKINNRDRRNTLREASKESSSTGQLRSTLNSSISNRCVQQIISAQNHLSYRRIKKLLHSASCTKSIA